MQIQKAKLLSIHLLIHQIKGQILLQLVTFTLKQHYTSAMSRLEWMMDETVQRVSNDIEMRALGPGRGRGASVGKIIIMNTWSPSPQWRDVPPFSHPRPWSKPWYFTTKHKRGGGGDITINTTLPILFPLHDSLTEVGRLRTEQREFEVTKCGRAVWPRICFKDKAIFHESLAWTEKAGKCLGDLWVSI